MRHHIYEKKQTLNEAVESAVTECIKEGILEDFLKENRAEVVAMSIFEFDEEKELKLYREGEFQYGREEGMKEGIERGIKEGRKEGHEEGLKEGIEQGIETSIKKLLKNHFTVEEVAHLLEVDRDYISRILEGV